MGKKKSTTYPSRYLVGQSWGVDAHESRGLLDVDLPLLELLKDLVVVGVRQERRRRIRRQLRRTATDVPSVFDVPEKFSVAAVQGPVRHAQKLGPALHVDLFVPDGLKHWWNTISNSISRVRALANELNFCFHTCEKNLSMKGKN